MLTLTARDNLETPVNLTCMFLDDGRKPEYSERTGDYIQAPQPGFEHGTLLTVLTTTPHSFQFSKFYSN